MKRYYIRTTLRGATSDFMSEFRKDVILVLLNGGS
jgi:hypothetical protein